MIHININNDILTNSCATAWMRSNLVWHTNLHKGAAIVAMQILYEISHSAMRFGVELLCIWEKTQILYLLFAWYIFVKVLVYSECLYVWSVKAIY